jgi:hypothetical protein
VGSPKIPLAFYQEIRAMDAKQKAKLERYFRNSNRFLWGLGHKNQKDTYLWLKEYGKQQLGSDFDFKEGPYKEVIAQLLQEPGIERLLANIVVPRVKELYSENVLEFLRVSWNAGTLPDISYLQHFAIDVKNVNPFLEINKWYKYVERWSDFAGVWFEEMDDLLGLSK